MKYVSFFFYQNIDYSVQTNNLQQTKINENNMIKISQTILQGENKSEEVECIMAIIMIYVIMIVITMIIAKVNQT